MWHQFSEPSLGPFHEQPAACVWQFGRREVVSPRRQGWPATASRAAAGRPGLTVPHRRHKQKRLDRFVPSEAGSRRRPGTRPARPRDGQAHQLNASLTPNQAVQASQPACKGRGGLPQVEALAPSAGHLCARKPAHTVCLHTQGLSPGSLGEASVCLAPSPLARSPSRAASNQPARSPSARAPSGARPWKRRLCDPLAFRRR